MVAILREADATSVAAAAKKHKVSEQTIYSWRKHFGELAPSDVKRLRTLEAENARLKRLLAERDLDISVLKEINAKKRRACGLIGLPRSCLSYVLRLPAKDAPVIEAMKTLSSQYPRYGYRRIRIFLRRAGHELGVHRTHRLWRQAGLQLPRRRPRRRIAIGRPRPLPPADATFLWAYDFVFDATATGQQIKCLTVVDEFTRECLAIDGAGSIRSKRVIEVLSRLDSVHGAPMFLRSDNGPEFVSRAILEWIAQSGIATALIDPGKPWQNANNESFNGKFRDECLSLEWFRSRAEAKVVIETWRHHYNAVRPHSSLNYLTPIEFKQQHHPIPNRAVFQE
jgi:putative transposase